MLELKSIDAGYGGIADNKAEGERLLRALGNRTRLMMRNHGVLVVADTIAEAFHDLYYLERDHAKALAISGGAAAQRVASEQRLVQEARAQGATGGPGESPPHIFYQLISQASDPDSSRFTYALTVENLGVKLGKEVRLVVRKTGEGYRVVYFEEREAAAG